MAEDPSPSVRRGRELREAARAPRRQLCLQLEQGDKALLPVPTSPCCGLFWGLDFTRSKNRDSARTHGGAILPSAGCWCGEQAAAAGSQPCPQPRSPPPGLGFGMLGALEQLGSWAAQEGSGSPR